MTHNEKGVMSAELYKLRFYLVRNSEGKYFRSKGYGGYGSSWVEDVGKAKVYQKIGQARSRVTYWAGEWPEYGVPTVIEFGVGQIDVLQEDDRVAKAIASKARKRSARERNAIVNRINGLVRTLEAGSAERRRLEQVLEEIDKGKK